MSKRPRDMRNDPRFQRWAEDARRGLQQLDDSAITAALITPASVNDMDIHQALEIGASLLLGKPLLLVVVPGAKVPPGLAKAADEIVEIDGDVNTPANQVRMRAALKRMGVGDDPAD